LRAKDERTAGNISAAELAEVEDDAVRDAISLQEDIGLKVITDGEFRRHIYFGHFAGAVDGFEEMEAEMAFKDESGKPMTYRTDVVTSRLRRVRGIATGEYKFVQHHTSRTPKVTLPSPGGMHYFRWHEGISEQAYPDIEEFYGDLVAIYRAELRGLAEVGARYVQFDDVALALLCDPDRRAEAAARGYDPDELVARYIEVTNAMLEERPENMVVAMHLCRGNNQGKWLGAGGYDYVAEQAFAGLRMDAFFLEYDSERSGGFEPLRYVPRDKHVVLGLVTSKTPELEDSALLERRIDEAAQYFPGERLSLSPQCGFASVEKGNPLTADDQRRKLELVVDVAGKVWT
jgi:5-methyltetrahydropteroyltriglutamate--homocysteine methyltransferase